MTVLLPRTILDTGVTLIWLSVVRSCRSLGLKWWTLLRMLLNRLSCIGLLGLGGQTLTTLFCIVQLFGLAMAGDRVKFICIRKLCSRVLLSCLFPWVMNEVLCIALVVGRCRMVVPIAASSMNGGWTVFVVSVVSIRRCRVTTLFEGDIWLQGAALYVGRLNIASAGVKNDSVVCTVVTWWLLWVTRMMGVLCVVLCVTRVVLRFLGVLDRTRALDTGR